MSDVPKQPIRFLLSDMDGTLLLPDHTLSQRTIDAVRALREAGVLFSLATGRPQQIRGAVAESHRTSTAQHQHIGIKFAHSFLVV